MLCPYTILTVLQVAQGTSGSRTDARNPHACQKSTAVKISAYRHPSAHQGSCPEPLSSVRMASSTWTTASLACCISGMVDYIDPCTSRINNIATHDIPFTSPFAVAVFVHRPAVASNINISRSSAFLVDDFIAPAAVPKFDESGRCIFA
jgi:hypothetical protein